MPLSYSMFVRKRLTTKHGMLKLRNFVKWKNQNSPLNGCEFHTALFRELRNLLRCNSVTISESQAFSTLKLSPKETSLANWYHVQDPKICQYYVSIESNYRNRLTFLNKHRVLSGHLDASFSRNCQSFYQKFSYKFVLRKSVEKVSRKCREHGDFIVDRNDLWNCLVFPSNHKTLLRGLNKTFYW